MPATVDTRVVEMRFDNKKFEANAEETLKTLKKLDDSLDLSDSAKSFTEIQRAAEKVDLSKLQNAAEAVTNKFSVLGTIADQVLRNITDKVANAVTGMIRSFTIAPISAGFDKYAAKTEAVQTIMHATSKDIKTVSDNLAKLNTYTDETSYNFSDMVGTISKFTSAGVELEDAELAVEGIANWAATAGVGASKASGAFYNLSQAMSTGALKVQDWKSIEILNMSTNEFKETAISVAKALIESGEASEDMKLAFNKAQPTVDNFRETLQTGWLDKDVMRETFKVYADQTTEFGLNAFHAAQEAKTFKDAIDAVKDAVSTGWLNVFEQIFGNYKEATELWTWVATELSEAFAAPTGWLLDIFTSWHEMGGYEDLMQSIRNIWDSIKSIVTSLVGVVGEVFPVDMVDVLTQATAKLRQFSETMRTYFVMDELPEIIDATRSAFDEEAGTLGEVDKAAARARQSQKDLNNDAKKHLSPMQETFRGLLSIAKAVASVSGGLLKIALPFVKLLVPIANLVTTITGKIGELISGLVDLIFESKTYKNTIEFLTGVSEGIVKWVGLAINSVADFIENFRKHPLIKRFGKALSSVKETLKEFASPIIERGKNIISGFFDWIGKINWQPLLTVFGAIGAAFGWVIKTVSNVISTVYTAVSPYISAFAKFAGSALSSIAQIAGPWLSSIWEKIAKFFSGLSIDKVTSKVQKFIQTVKKFPIVSKFLNVLTKIRDGFASFASPLLEKAQAFFSKFGLSFEKIGDDVEKSTLGERIGRIFSGIVDVIKNAFSGASSGVSSALEPIKNAILSFFGKLPEDVDGPITQSAVLLEKFHTIFDKLLGAFKLLKDYLQTSGISGIFDWMETQFTRVRGLLAGFDLGDAISKAIGIGTIAVLIKLFKTLSTFNGISINLADTVSNLKAFSASLKSIGSTLKDLKKSVDSLIQANTIIRFAVAVSILAISLVMLAKTAKDGGLWEGLGALAGIIVLMTVALIILNKSITKIGDDSQNNAAAIAKATAGLLIISLSLVVLAKAMAVLAPYAKDKSIWTAFEIIALLLGIITVCTLALSHSGDSMVKTSAGLIAIAVSVGLLVLSFRLLMPALEKLSELLSPNFTGVILGLTVAFVALVTFTIAINRMAPEMVKASASLLILAGAVGILGVAALIFSKVKVGAVVGVLVVLASLVGALALLAVIARSLGTDQIGSGIAKLAASLILMTVALYGLLGAIAFLGAFKVESLIKGVTAVIAIILALAGSMAIADKATRGRRIGFGLAAMSFVILSFAASVALLSMFDFKKLIGPAIMLGVLVIALGVALGLIGAMGKKANAFAKYEAIGVALAVAIAALVGAIWLLSMMEPHKMLAGVLGMTTVLIALGLMLLMAQNAIAATSSASGIVSIISMIVIIGGIAGALWFISQLPIGQLVASTLALSKLLIVLGISLSMTFKAMSKTSDKMGVGNTIASLLMPIVMIGAIVAAVAILSQFPIDQITGICNSLAKVLPALGVAIAGMSIVAAGTGGITLGGLLSAFGLVIAFTLGIGIALGALAALAGLLAQIEGIKEFLQSGAEIMSLVGEVIGSVIGGFITGALGPLLDGVPKLMASLMDFITGIDEFLQSLNDLEIDESKINALSGVATMILKLTAAELLESLANWVSGGKAMSFSEFAEGLKDLGKGIKDYENALGDGVDSDKIAASASAVEAIAEVAKKLPREGGIIDAILGRATTLGEFAQEMALAAPKIMSFANQSHGIASHEQDIVSCAVALRALVDVANAIKPDTNWSWFGYTSESTDLLEFARTLGSPSDGPSIGEALSSFASDTAKINTGHFRSVIASLGKLVEVGNELTPTTNSDMSGNTWTTYTESANAVATFLKSLINGENGESLGKNIAKFSDDVKDVKADKVRAVANAIGNLATVGEKMVPTDISKGWGFYKEHTQTLGEFIQSLASPNSDGETLASYLTTFSQDMADVNADSVKAAAGAIGALVDVGSSIQTVTKMSGSNTTITKVGDLGRFIEDLATAAPNLVTFSDAMTDPVLDKLSRIKAIFNGFTTIATSISESPNVAAGIYEFAGGLNSAAGQFVEACGLMDLADLDAMRAKVEEVQGNEDLLALVTEVAQTIVGAFIEQAESYTESNKNKVAQNIVSAFVGAIKAKKQLFYSAGANAVIGFVDGLNSEVYRVSQIGSNLGESAIQALRRILRISSPSRVMMDLGSYTGQGFVKGLEKWVEPASDTSSSLAESMLASVASVIDYVQAILNGELAVDLTIRPVLDLSNISGGASTINSMFSRKQAISANIGGTLSGSRGEVSELVSICWKILGEIQNGSDIYIDDDVLAGRINRRLARP